MNKRVSLTLLVIGILFVANLTASALRVSPAAFSVKQAPATVKTYMLTVTNNTTKTEEVRLYLGDWLREPNGKHDWDIPPRGARWDLQGVIPAGKTFAFRYRTQLPADGDLKVSGHFLMRKPGFAGPVIGPSAITAGAIGVVPTPPADSIPWVGRTILGINPIGMVTVQLTVHCPVQCAGITIYEEFSRSVHIEQIDSPEVAIHTVNRSCIDWINLSQDRLTLDPGKSQGIQVKITTPPHFSGTYWATIFVETRPQITIKEGTQIANIYRTAVKVYVTAPGTQRLTGEVTKVAVINNDKLKIQFSFVNTGNVQLASTGTVEIIDRTGQTVRSLPIETFYVLPGSYAIETVDAAPLPPGIYQARVTIDYGGENLAGGVRAFRVK